MPTVVRTSQQILYVKIFIVPNTKLFQIQVNPTCLLVQWIQVDRYKYHVRRFTLVRRSRFGITENLWIIHIVEVKRYIVLQRTVRASDSVEFRYKRSNRMGRGSVPSADLILLTIQVFFTSLSYRNILSKFERGTVNAVARR